MRRSSSSAGPPAMSASCGDRSSRSDLLPLTESRCGMDRRSSRKRVPRMVKLGKGRAGGCSATCDCRAVRLATRCKCFDLVALLFVTRCRARRDRGCPAETAGLHAHSRLPITSPSRRPTRIEDRVGPGIDRAAARHRQHRSPAPPISSPCTTPAGRPTGRCSTARSRATRRARSRSIG